MSIHTHPSILQAQNDHQALLFLLDAVGVRSSVDIDALSPKWKIELLSFVRRDLWAYSVTKENAYREVLNIILKEKVFFVLRTLSLEHGLWDGSRDLVDLFSERKRQKALSLLISDANSQKWDIRANSQDIGELFWE